MSNIEELPKEFYSLQGNTVSEKRKHLNYYIKKIKIDIKSEDDLNLLTKSITPRNELERSFKVEILLQLQRNNQILDILKGTDIVLKAKIYKNWKFFSNVFSNMECHTFFNDIIPNISHSCTLKIIITRLSKVLRNEDLADEYFNSLREKCGIRTARIILPACTIGLVKSATQIYKLHLTSKELLIFVKKDEDFLRFYFNIVPTFKFRIYFVNEYKKIAQYVGRTDADLFWNLYDAYDFNNPNIEINLGESVFDFLFSHDEAKPSDREICVNMFNPRRVYNILSRRRKMDVLLANFCQGGEDEFYKIYVKNEGREFYSIQMFLDGMPKFNYFRYLNEAFKLKFGKDLLDYPKYFNKVILKTTPAPEREEILNKIVKENDELLYFYDIKRSIPLLKERLDKNIENPDDYLKQLYRTCKFHRDQNALLDVSKYIVDKYRQREHLINDISMKMVRWPNSAKFKPEIWNLIDEMLGIIEYSDDHFTSSGFTDYLHKHIINSVDNNTPFTKLFEAMLNRNTDNFLNFENESGNVKHYCEAACKLMTSMRKKNYFRYEVEHLLSSIAEFNSNLKNDSISLQDYGHLLEIVAKQGVYYGNDYIKYGAKNNLHSSFHVLYLKRFELMYDHKGFAEFAQKKPDFFLKFLLVLDVESVRLLNNTSFENFTYEMRCQLRDYCLDILTLSDELKANNVAVALKLLSLINEDEFLNVLKRIDLLELHEIDDSRNLIKKFLSESLKGSVTRINDFLPAAVKVYKITKSKYYLGPIHSYLHKISLNQAKAILKLFSEHSIVQLRRLAVTLANIFLTKQELHDWIKEMNSKETDSSVKRHLHKKSFYLFIENQNEANFALLKNNIDLTGDDSRCVLDFSSKLHLILPDYCERYVSYTFEIVSKHGDIKNYKKKLLMRIKPPVHQYLSLAFLKALLKESPFHTTRTRNSHHGICKSASPKDNYYAEFLFYASEKNQDGLLDFIFENLKAYVDESWSDIIDDEVFSNVYEFMRAFCKYTFRLLPQNGIVARFYNKWKLIFPTSYFQSKFLMLEFLHLYSECQYEVAQFGRKSSELLRTFVDRYEGLIFGIYCKHLNKFISAANIDLFSFLFGFVEDKRDPLTCSAVIKMLPMLCSIPYTDEPKLEKLRCILRNCNEPMVNIYLSEYFRDTY